MSQYLSSDDYLPHDAPMPLLEEVISMADETITYHATISANSVLTPFLSPDSNLPCWLTLELMAQTIGVQSGWYCQQQGQAGITSGMVLDICESICATSVLPARKTLSIHAKLLMRNARFDSFRCAIRADNETLATGRTDTFQPTPEKINTLFQ